MMTTTLPDFPLAACRGMDPSLFVAAETVSDWVEVSFEEEAKKVCRRCPERGPCLDYALANPILTGIWGATTERERKKIRAGQEP